MPLPGSCMAHLLDALHHILYGVAGVALPLALPTLPPGALNAVGERPDTCLWDVDDGIVTKDCMRSTTTSPRALSTQAS